MKLNSLQRCKPLLGTYVELSLQGRYSQQALLNFSEDAFRELQQLHDKLSFHNANSDLSQLNTKLLDQNSGAIALTKELKEILIIGQSMHSLSEGFYDLTIAPHLVLSQQLPNHLGMSHQNYGNFSHISIADNTLHTTKPVCIDLGGIAKGYAVDQAITKIPKDCTVSINAGGDLYHSHWQGEFVEIKYGKRIFAKKRIKMKNSALATSANYFQGNQSAFINPKTNQQRTIKGSISVFASSVMIADALTKVVLLTPKNKIISILKSFDAQAIKINRLGFSANM